MYRTRREGCGITRHPRAGARVTLTESRRRAERRALPSQRRRPNRVRSPATADAGTSRRRPRSRSGRPEGYVQLSYLPRGCSSFATTQTPARGGCVSARKLRPASKPLHRRRRTADLIRPGAYRLLPTPTPCGGLRPVSSSARHRSYPARPRASRTPSPRHRQFPALSETAAPARSPWSWSNRIDARKPLTTVAKVSENLSKDTTPMRDRRTTVLRSSQCGRPGGLKNRFSKDHSRTGRPSVAVAIDVVICGPALLRADSLLLPSVRRRRDRVFY